MQRDRIRRLLNRLRERLWVRPVAIALLSIAVAFGARLADGTGLGDIVPAISAESVESLLTVMASSMLVIATFAVASMVAAYASAGTTATPRTFALVVSDDVSQNALSTFVGAFIFSIVALTALKNEYFGAAGLFSLFVLTIATFALVILTFLRWVDRIARLGRLGTTVDRVERAVDAALVRRRAAPTLGGVSVASDGAQGQPIFSEQVGYVRHIDVAALQDWAERCNGRVVVAALPGTFAAPGRVLAYVSIAPPGRPVPNRERIAHAFAIGDGRTFDDDPRFGLVVLSEIAGRALSPAINDPGTAIDVIGTLVRLFVRWSAPNPLEADEAEPLARVEVPELSIMDMFDDAFTAIARDGASTVEVSIRLQKALYSLTRAGDHAMQDAAIQHSRLALQRSEQALRLEHDVMAVRAAAAWTESVSTEAVRHGSTSASTAAPVGQVHPRDPVTSD